MKPPPAARFPLPALLVAAALGPVADSATVQENDLLGPVLLELRIKPDEFSNLLGSRPLVVEGMTWDPLDGEDQ